jgi:hypothetical protein
MAAMNNQTPAAPPASGASTPKQALLEAFDSVLKKQAEEREAEQRQAEALRRGRARVRPTVWAAAVLAAFLCTYLYIERPEWLYPASAAPETVEITEASLRIGMANVAQHVERYRQRTGKLPATLLEAGTQMDGIAYQALDSADWRLVGSHANIELTLVSREPLARFLGNSFDVITRRPR